MGLTKKGKGSKIVLTTDETGFPLSETVESAQISEYRLALPTVDKIDVPIRPFHSLKRPQKIVADRGYDARWLRVALRERNIKPIIPQRRKPNTNIIPKVNGKIKKDYAKRWIIERTFAWLNWFRRLDIRWERLPEVFEGFLKVACILICLKGVLK